MATITINISDAIATRAINGFCKHYGYSPTLQNGDPNPETKSQFVKRKIIEFLKAAVKASEIEDATNAAATTAGNSADTDIIIT